MSQDQDRQVAEYGSVSWGTMRNQDLIPTFCAELRHLGNRESELIRIESRIESLNEYDDYWNSEESMFDLEWLFDTLNEYAPDDAYFGANEGDGSDYGFWQYDELYLQD